MRRKHGHSSRLLGTVVGVHGYYERILPVDEGGSDMVNVNEDLGGGHARPTEGVLYIQESWRHQRVTGRGEM
ncbi:unnamed protein product [Peniophora sp. CBMAI 1063]|nr:unnamed protein product [Peniophora sp. CBMAI 1063]